MGSIELLYDRKLASALTEDLKSTSSVICTCLELNPFVASFFGDFLASGGSLSVLANHPKRFKNSYEKQFSVRKTLHEKGALVHWFRSPRLLHQKTILVAPDIVYLGSHNLSAKAFFSNHEVTVRIKDPSLFSRLRDRQLILCGMSPQSSS